MCFEYVIVFIIVILCLLLTILLFCIHTTKTCLYCNKAYPNKYNYCPWCGKTPKIHKYLVTLELQSANPDTNIIKNDIEWIPHEIKIIDIKRK